MVFMVADRKCGTFRHGHLLCRRRTTVRSEAARHNRGHGLSPRVAVGREPRELHHVGFDELDVPAYLAGPSPRVLGPLSVLPRQHQELRRSSTDPEMIRLRPNLATPSLPQELRRRRRCEETAARTVRTPAAPELAVGRRLSFAEWHHLVELRPNAGNRALDDHLALSAHNHVP